jgi:hypothetical protein
MTSRPTHRRTAQTAEPRRSLKPLGALDRAIYQASLAVRWRIVAENAPPGSTTSRRAHDEWQKASERAFNNFMIVRKALGYDPEADEPEPARHWDKSAMED